MDIITNIYLVNVVVSSNCVIINNVKMFLYRVIILIIALIVIIIKKWKNLCKVLHSHIIKMLKCYILFILAAVVSVV